MAYSSKENTGRKKKWAHRGVRTLRVLYLVELGGIEVFGGMGFWKNGICGKLGYVEV